MAKKDLNQALQENQDKITQLDVDYLVGKVKEKDYRNRRERLRKNVKRIIKDTGKGKYTDPIKYPNIFK